MKTEIEQVKSNAVEESNSQKTIVGGSLVLPKRWCNFCGRATTHSLNARVCLVCGFAAYDST